LGWVFEHGDEPLRDPVSTGTIRQLLAAGYLNRTDIAWKSFKRNGEMELSSPATVEIAAKDDNSSPDAEGM
jgi:hypothetical protein